MVSRNLITKSVLAILIATPLARPITAGEADAVFLDFMNEKITASNVIMDDTTGEAVGISETGVLSPSGESTQETISLAGPVPPIPELWSFNFSCDVDNYWVSVMARDSDGAPNTMTAMFNWTSSAPSGGGGSMYHSTFYTSATTVGHSVKFVKDPTPHFHGGGWTLTGTVIVTDASANSTQMVTTCVIP